MHEMSYEALNLESHEAKWPNVLLAKTNPFHINPYISHFVLLKEVLHGRWIPLLSLYSSLKKNIKYNGGGLGQDLIHHDQCLHVSTSYHFKTEPYSPYLWSPMKQKIRAKYSLNITEYKTELESQVKQWTSSK